MLSFLYGSTLTSIHNYWKNHSFDLWTFVGKVMFLLFNMLSRLAITFLPRSKRLLISWLQSPSAVILEPRKIKSATVSTVCLISANYRVLICFTYHIQSGSLFYVYFGFLCLQVSSVSNFHPDTRGRRQSLI